MKFVSLRLVVKFLLCCIGSTAALSLPLSAAPLAVTVANAADTIITKSLPTSTTSDGPASGGITTRRAFVTVTAPMAILATTTTATILTAHASIANAQDSSSNASTSSTYQILRPEWGFTFTPPQDFEIGKKPLQTHLEEVNFNSMLRKGYQFGITVDPVRINSLDEFGTPEQIAARVVLAEVNRDGVLDVTLVEDPVVVTVEGNPTTSSPSDSAPNNSKYIILNYLSQGKRGDKHFICKICIQRNKLYVLTAQCKEEEYVLKKKELMQAVDSFKVLML